ncbi:conserved hypothetical protein [Candidatus Zixiibacteriota bacterium]|nr:conserved hypothetical protein [candidate division Zixibacteria bacterium]
MNIFDRLMTLDRRWIFLFVALVCVVTYAIPFTIKLNKSPEVKAVFNFIDTLKPNDVIFVAVDYDPSSLAELHPMFYAIVEQAFRKHVKVIFSALSQNGPAMVDQAIKAVADSVKQDRTYNGVFYKGRQVENGVDYCFLGYKPYPALIILAMGQGFRIPFPTDYYGTPLDSLPMMRSIRNYDQVKCVVELSSGSSSDMWITYGQSRYNFPLALGLTGVMSADYYPYLNSGQVFGIMGGLLGAAQYEALADNPGEALDGMRIQVYAHLVIIIFIIMGNIGFILARRKARKG